MYSDQELHQKINKITNTASLFSMTGFSIKKSPYINRRDQLIKELVEGINKERSRTNFKPTTPRLLAIQINKNPFLSKDDDALEEIKKECEAMGSYWKLYWLIKQKKNEEGKQNY